MRPAGRAGELFEAFSRITGRAFTDERLLSCSVLSKAPHHADVLRRFLLRSPPRPLTVVQAVRHCCRYVLANGLHLLFLAASLVFIRLQGWRRPCLCPKTRGKDGRLFVIDTFAVLPRIARQDRFTDPYLPGLAEEIARHGHEIRYFYRLYGTRNPRTLWRSIQTLRKAKPGFLEAHLLTAGDWLALFRHLWIYPFSLYRLIRSLQTSPASSPEAYIREALMHTAGQCVLTGEARRLAARRLALLLAEQQDRAEVISWYENQTVNKALVRGLRQGSALSGRHIPVTGTQLLLWPPALLNNHADDREAALGLAPDRVLVNGPHYLPEHSAQPYAVGPALRYEGIFRCPPEDRCADREHARGRLLLVLLSYYPQEIERTLSLTLALAGQGWDVVYKFHPATEPERYCRLLPDRPCLATGDLQAELGQVLTRRGMVLGSGSGALTEAVAQGVPVLVVEDPSGDRELDLSCLPEWGRGLLWEGVGTASELEQALGCMLRNMECPEKQKEIHSKRRALREAMFCEPTPERIRAAFFL